MVGGSFSNPAERQMRESISIENSESVVRVPRSGLVLFVQKVDEEGSGMV